MVNRTAFYGRIYSGNAKTVGDILGQWLGIDPLEEKIRISGEEFVFENPNIYVFVESAFQPQKGQERFLLEGNTSAGLEETKGTLQKLLHVCSERGVSCTLEYVEVNEAGEEVSPQFHVD